MCLRTEALTQGFFQLRHVSEGRDTSGAQRDNVVHHTEEHAQVLRELSKVTLGRLSSRSSVYLLLYIYISSFVLCIGPSY